MPPPDAATDYGAAEVQGSIAVPAGLSLLQKLFRFSGPGVLVAVGYMDPGNWATDIEAGSRYGYALLFVVAASSLAAIVLQTLAARLGIASGRDLAQLARQPAARYGFLPKLRSSPVTSPRCSGVRWRSSCCSVSRCGSASS
jgi:manganese transport protein